MDFESLEDEGLNFNLDLNEGNINNIFDVASEAK